MPIMPKMAFSDFALVDRELNAMNNKVHGQYNRLAFFSLCNVLEHV